MANKSDIEWTEQTWNPTTGCTKISPGCKYCYAEPLAVRLKAMGANGYQNGFNLSLMPDRLSQPLKRKRPTLYFVNSMSDLFHEDIPDEYLDRVFNTIRNTPQHTYQILTKRASRLPEYFSRVKCPKNVWLGVTVEDIEYGVPRIEHLRRVDTSVRFLSCEPLLEDLGDINLQGIHWVIVGGESGHRARIMQPNWIENIKIQCEIEGIPFFFKQWGRWGPDGVKRNKKANGRLYAGSTWNAMPALS